MAKFSIDVSPSKIIDLSYPLQPGMTLMKPVYPDLEYITPADSRPEIDNTGYPLNGYFARFVTNGPNGLLELYGTHVEASSHAFGTRGLNINDYPMNSFVGPGVVIDATNRVVSDPGYKIGLDNLLDWEVKHGRIPDGAILILKTGWGERWGDYNAFLGISPDGSRHIPGISPDACRWLVDNRHINAIGTETATIDGQPHADVPGYPAGRLPHEIAREIIMQPPHNILIIEYMANVDRLPEAGSVIVCAPVNFVGGSGGMVRGIAFLP